MSSKSKYPWYKERLKTKYSKDINPVNYYKNWTFLKDGQDDFRDGFPSTDENVIIKPRRGPSPAFLLDDKSSTGKSKFSCSSFKDATQVNFSQKTALSTLREAILTIRHLFIPKNEVSKLFKNINFYTMFMC